MRSSVILPCCHRVTNDFEVWSQGHSPISAVTIVTQVVALGILHLWE